jgi:hypothetical protein
MPSTLFDSAGLAIVAYAQVAGATGSSVSTTLSNSGVSTTRITTGLYQVFLPTGLTQDPSRDLIFIQPKAVPSTTAIQLGLHPLANLVEESAQVKQVRIWGVNDVGSGMTTTAIDSDFNVLVLRTILP